TWPVSLQVTVSTLLTSRHPMVVFWGPELIQIYNDAFRPILGDAGRHPAALGTSARAFWTDVWPMIGPMVDHVRHEGGATWNEDQLVPLLRDGRMQEAYWTHSYSPVLDDDGAPGGVLVVTQETTAKV